MGLIRAQATGCRKRRRAPSQVPAPCVRDHSRGLKYCEEGKRLFPKLRTTKLMICRDAPGILGLRFFQTQSWMIPHSKSYDNVIRTIVGMKSMDVRFFTLTAKPILGAQGLRNIPAPKSSSSLVSPTQDIILTRSTNLRDCLSAASESHCRAIKHSKRGKNIIFC